MEHALSLALASARQIKPDYDRTTMIAEIAGGYVCLKNFDMAARLSDEAYPADSDAASELGRAVARSGELKRVPALEQNMKHGTHSFLYGLVEGLVELHRFEAAKKMGAEDPVS